MKLTPIHSVAKALLLLLCGITRRRVEAITCFCDIGNCQDALCDGTWCLVGFQGSDSLVQNCGTEMAEVLSVCAVNWNGWEEVCSCDWDYCNTFSLLRKRMQLRNSQKEVTFKKAAGNDYYDDLTGVASDGQARQAGRANDVYPTTHPYQSNQLIVLLVVVPLGVGALAVCLVFVNYHCKMC